MQPTVLWNGMPALFWSWDRNVTEVYDDEVCAIKVCQLFLSIFFLPFTCVFVCVCVCEGTSCTLQRFAFTDNL